MKYLLILMMLLWCAGCKKETGPNYKAMADELRSQNFDLEIKIKRLESQLNQYRISTDVLNAKLQELPTKKLPGPGPEQESLMVRVKARNLTIGEWKSLFNNPDREVNKLQVTNILGKPDKVFKRKEANSFMAEQWVYKNSVVLEESENKKWDLLIFFSNDMVISVNAKADE